MCETCSATLKHRDKPNSFLLLQAECTYDKLICKQICNTQVAVNICSFSDDILSDKTISSWFLARISHFFIMRPKAYRNSHYDCVSFRGCNTITNVNKSAMLDRLDIELFISLPIGTKIVSNHSHFKCLNVAGYFQILTLSQSASIQLA